MEEAQDVPVNLTEILSGSKRKLETHVSWRHEAAIGMIRTPMLCMRFKPPCEDEYLLLMSALVSLQHGNRLIGHESGASVVYLFLIDVADLNRCDMRSFYTLRLGMVILENLPGMIGNQILE